jgi:hypothetical protein
VLTEKAPRIELKGTIDITHPDAQDQAHHEFPPPGIDQTHPRILLHLLQGALHTTQYTTKLHCSYIFCAIAIKEIPTGILTFASTRFKMGTMVSKEEI